MGTFKQTGAQSRVPGLKQKAQQANTTYEFAKELGAKGYANPAQSGAAQRVGASDQQTTVNLRGEYGG